MTNRSTSRRANTPIRKKTGGLWCLVLLLMIGATGFLAARPRPKKETPAPKTEEKQAPDEKAAEPGKQPEEMVRIFLDIYRTRGGASAVDYIYANNPYIFEKKDLMGNMKEKLGKLPEMIGKNQGDVLIQDRVFKGTIRIITYLVKHERQPIRFTFVFYRPADHWITYQFGFDDALNDESIKEMQLLRFDPIVK